MGLSLSDFSLGTFLHKELDKSSGRKNVRRQKKFEKKVLTAGDTLAQKGAAGETFGISFLKDSIAKGRGFESIGERLRSRAETDINSTEQELTRGRTTAGSAVQQKFKTVGGRRGFAGNLEQTVRRAKARTGINNRGENAVKNQQLKDRMSSVKSSVQRRGILQQTSADAARIRVGVEASAKAANAQVGQAFSGAAGAIVGGAVSGFGDNFFNSGAGEVSVSNDVGTAGADFQNMNFGFNDGFDFGGVGQGTQGGIMHG